METKRFICCAEGELFVGWLEDYSDHRTQGETLDEHEENLREIYRELSFGQVPFVRKVGELSIA